MAVLRVLIVDDQHDVRRVLASGIRTLQDNIEVVDVPSGEEAHLEAIRRPIDLLVTDVRLPGITGLELVNRIRRRLPEVKIILVTGVDDRDVRKQVTEAEADAFFYKPVHMADFLNTVEQCLGLKETAFVSLPSSDELDPDKIVPPPPSIKWISDLRQELDAVAVHLIDIVGQVEARAGDLPDEAGEEEWMKSIVSILGANVRVSNQLGAGKPSGFWYLQGTVYHLCVTHLGKSHAALVVTQQPLTSEQFQTIQDFSQLLDLDVQALTISPEELEDIPTDESMEEISEAEEIDLEELPLEELPELDALFSHASEIDNQEVDTFWDALADQDSHAEDAFGPKTLTYEQALKLGLAPDEEQQEEQQEEEK